MKIKVSYEALEAAQMCKAVRDVRYYLNGVAFMPDGHIASTNGHILFMASGCEFSRKIKDTIIFEIQKKPVTKYHHAYIDDQSLLITYHDELDLQVGVGMVKAIDGRFPDVSKIISPEKSPTDYIGLNAQYLSLIGKIGKLYNPKFSTVKMTLSSSIGLTVTDIIGFKGIDGKVYLMPARVD